ncbi:MAG: hypothetical protein Kilf2KO_11390 [Rhodospirillales bacterium]
MRSDVTLGRALASLLVLAVSLFFLAACVVREGAPPDPEVDEEARLIENDGGGLAESGIGARHG